MVQRHLLLKYLNRDIELETGRGTLYKGKIIDLDEWGIHFVPEDEKFKSAIISWNDVRKVILMEDEKTNMKKRAPIFES